MKFIFLLLVSLSAWGQAPKGPEYKPETCEWVKEIPRRILTGPAGNNCKEKTRVCTGYVMCDSVKEKAPKVIRLSTCHPDNCRENAAVACTKQEKFYSVGPSGLKNKASDRVKEAIFDEQLIDL